MVIIAVLKWCKLSQSIRLRKTYKNVKTSTFDHVHWTNKVKHQFRNDNSLFEYDMLHYLWLKVRIFTQYHFTVTILASDVSILIHFGKAHDIKRIKNSDRPLSGSLTFIGSIKLFCVSIGIIIPCVMSPLSGNFVDWK